MRGLIGAAAVLAIAWVMVIHDRTQNAPTRSSLPQAGDANSLGSLVANSSPAAFRQWEVEFARKMPGVQH